MEYEFSLSYILGSKELHPFGHLVAEAQQVIIGEIVRVADHQIQSIAT